MYNYVMVFLIISIVICESASSFTSQYHRSIPEAAKVKRNVIYDSSDVDLQLATDVDNDGDDGFEEDDGKNNVDDAAEHSSFLTRRNRARKKTAVGYFTSPFVDLSRDNEITNDVFSSDSQFGPPGSMVISLEPKTTKLGTDTITTPATIQLKFVNKTTTPTPTDFDWTYEDSSDSIDLFTSTDLENSTDPSPVTRLRDPEKLASAIKLFERYYSLRNSTAHPGLRRPTTELVKHRPGLRRPVFGTRVTSPSDEDEVLPADASLRPNFPFGTSLRFTPGLLQAFTNFIDAIGTAISDFLNAIADAFANNPVLTFLTLAALGFILLNLILNNAWFKRSSYRGGGYRGGGGYHRRSDVVNDSIEDAQRLEKILSVIEEFEHKYGEKLFLQ